MYYYFYDIETYKVYATYFIKPSDNMLVNAHIVSDVYFEEKEGLYKDLTIDKDSLEIKCNYFEINASNINLADKISILEAENEKLKIEQVQQNEEILVNMLANTEIFEMILSMMPSEVNLKSKGVNPMVEVYATLIIKGVKSIDDVPLVIREQVIERLKQLEVPVK